VYGKVGRLSGGEPDDRVLCGSVVVDRSLGNSYPSHFLPVSVHRLPGEEHVSTKQLAGYEQRLCCRLTGRLGLIAFDSSNLGDRQFSVAASNVSQLR
jgi:hypothetical protein